MLITKSACVVCVRVYVCVRACVLNWVGSSIFENFPMCIHRKKLANNCSIVTNFICAATKIVFGSEIWALTCLRSLFNHSRTTTHKKKKKNISLIITLITNMSLAHFFIFVIVGDNMGRIELIFIPPFTNRLG